MKKLLSTILLSSLSAFVFGQSITLDPKTTSPAGLQVNSDLAFRKQKRETVNGGWTNYPRDNSSVLIFEGGGSLNGIADGQDGVIVYVFNGYPTGVTAGALLLQHENTSSTAANRIMTPDGLDFSVGNGGVALIYDGTKQRWRVATPAQTGGGSFSGWGLTGNGGTNPATQFIGTTDAQGFIVKTNNLERISVESGGDVGIGITSPDSKLHVARGGAGAVTAQSSSVATIESNSSAFFSILTPATGAGAVYFGSPISNSRSYIHYNHNNDKMSIATTGVTRMTIDGTGNVGIGTTTPEAKLSISGDVVLSQKAQITTPGTQNALDRQGASYIVLDANVTINGIAGGVDGMLVFMYSGLNSTVILNNANASAAVNDQIYTNTGAAITLSGRGGVTLLYVVNGWRVIGVAN